MNVLAWHRSRGTSSALTLLIFTVVLAAASVGFLACVGVDARTSLAIVAVVIVQAIGGAIAWRFVRPGCQVFELGGMALAVGTSLSVIAGLAVKVILNQNWGWWVPTALLVILAIGRRLRNGSNASRVVAPDRASIIAAIVAVIAGGASLVANISHYPLSWQGSWSLYHPDMPFFEALSTSLAKFGPLHSIFMPGAQIRYHWLSYAWSGQVSAASSAQEFVMLTRGFQLVVVMASSLLVISWTRRVTRHVLAPTLAVLLLLTGGYVGATYGGILNFDSPSQSMGVVWLLATAIAILTFVQGRAVQSRVTAMAWVGLIAMLGFATTGGKISAAIPALVGAGVMTGAGCLMRAAWTRRATMATAALWLGGALAYVLILSGANGGGGLSLGSLIDRSSSQQGMNPIEGSLGIALGTGLLALAVALRWSGVVWLATQRQHRRSPEWLFAVGLALSSLLLLIAFTGFNEIWFASAASAPLAVISTEGFESALDALTRLHRRSSASVIWVSLALAVCIYGAVWVVWQTGPAGGSVWQSTWRWTGPILALVLGLLAGGLVSRFAEGGGSVADPRTAAAPPRRLAILAGCTVVLVLVAVPGRLLGVGTGMIGRPPGLRPDTFSMGIAPIVRGHDTVLIGNIPWDVIEAGNWLRAHAGQSDVLATNLTFGPLIPAVTGLQSFVSGIQYQAPYGRPSTAPQLLVHDDQIWQFLRMPSAQTVQPLCASSVSWVWVDPTQTPIRQWEPQATIVYRNASAIILRLNPSSCGLGH